MTLPPVLSAWLPPGVLPPWAQLALLVLILLFVFAFLLMPFAVFGLKGRLDLLEAQLDDIHAELRMVSMRLGDAEPPARAPRAAERREVEPAARTEPRLRVPPRD